MYGIGVHDEKFHTHTEKLRNNIFKEKEIARMGMRG